MFFLNENCDVWNNQYESRWCKHCWYQVWQWLRGVSCCKFLKEVKCKVYVCFRRKSLHTARNVRALQGMVWQSTASGFAGKSKILNLDESFLTNLYNDFAELTVNCKVLVTHDLCSRELVEESWIWYSYILVILQMILPQTIPLSPTSSSFMI